MDKLTSTFCPHQVSARFQFTFGRVKLEGAVLGQPLSGIAGIEQILSRLYVLDTHLAKQHIQVVAGHVQFLVMYL